MKLQTAIKEVEQQIYAVLDSRPDGLTIQQLNRELGVQESSPKYWFNITVLNNLERRGYVDKDILYRRYSIGKRISNSR
jgi:DNA-binding IclR family transcriptional regulator